MLARAESVTRAAAAVAQELESTRAALKEKTDEAQLANLEAAELKVGGLSAGNQYPTQKQTPASKPTPEQIGASLERPVSTLNKNQFRRLAPRVSD